jgi:hypothetical protein
MRESPAKFESRSGRTYPGDDLRGYRFHTGAPLQPLASDETCPVLFRDVGPVGMTLFLRGELLRLAGPLSPITYMRTEEYVEPYTDHEQIGRLVFLRPLELQPWFSGVHHIYVARAQRMTEADSIGFVPGDVPLAKAAQLLADVTTAQELREVFAGKLHDDACAETLRRLSVLSEQLADSERLAEPLRCLLQSGDSAGRERARATMDRLDISEHDLCAAYHHLSRERREHLNDALRRCGTCAASWHA